MTQTPLWTTEALARAMGGRILGKPAPAVTDISIDTRTLNAGEAYVAIKGLAHDGHAFAAAALEKGASVAVVSEDWAQSAPPGAYIVVADPLKALEKAGIVARARTAAKIVGITGSVGKTSTKETLARVLAREGRTHAPPKSFNNHIGVPLTLARMPAGAEFGVFEIGMNHAGEITPLTRMVRPDVAVVTAIEAVHIENLGSIEAIADAKAEIFVGVEHGGVAVLPRDNRFYERLAKAARAAGIETIVSFGEHEEADVRLMRIVLAAECSTVYARVMGTDVTYKFGAPGKHLAMNSLAVLAAAKLVGCDLALAALSLGETRAVAGRGEKSLRRLPSGSFTLLDESYNANPVSVRAAISVAAGAPKSPQGRRIVVLGDMLELGADAERLHAELAEPIDKGGIDLVFCSGPMMRHLWDRLPPHRRAGYAPTAAELEPLVIRGLKAGDVVMVKGSRGSRMAPLVETLKATFEAVPAEDQQGAA